MGKSVNSQEPHADRERSVHEYAEIIQSSWNRAWSTLKSSPGNLEAAIELVRLTLSYCVLNRERYVRVLSVAKTLEKKLTAEKLNAAFEDWQWVIDYLSSMTGKIELSPLEKQPPTKRSLINRSLRIGIDIRCMEIESTRNRGIGRYVTNLVKQLARVESRHRIFLYGNEAPWDVDDVYGLMTAPNIEYRTYHRGFASEIDVYLITDPLPVLAGRDLLPYPLDDVPVATIIYDLIPLAYPARYIAANEKIHRQYIGSLREIVKLSSCYLPISNFVGEELQERVGINSELIFPILGGLDETFLKPVTQAQTAKLLQENGIAADYFIYAGGADFRKNIETLLKAFIEFRDQNSKQCQLVLVGESMRKRVQNQLKGTRGERYIDDVVCPGFVSDDELRGLYSRAIALVFPSLHEGFGLPALEAMACNCPVIASNTTSLKEIVDHAGILVNPHSSAEIAFAMRQLHENKELADEYRLRGKRRALQYTWEDVAKRTLAAIGNIVVDDRRLVAPSRKLRVLVQNRPDAFSARGGDTVVMNQLYKSLRDLDVEIDIACGSPNLSEIDLVHLINLTVRETGTEVARNAARYSVPMVVTTLLEDWPRYLEKSLETARVFHQYLRSGQNESCFREGMERVKNLTARTIVGNEHIVDYASALIACGNTEALLLRQTYPKAEDKIGIAQFAVTDMSKYAFAEPKEIQKAFGFGEYIICCGRIETRKNQLMLLKALEDCDIPVMLVGGGFSAQPEYVQLVSSYKRKGRLIPVQRVSLHKLANIMKGARAHVLPSWYELPGLVTLEAASCGTPVVASDWGAILDYLPEHLIHTCQPDDPESIYNATMKAIKTPRSQELAECAKYYTVESFGKQVFDVYERVMSGKFPQREASQSSVSNFENNSNIKAKRQEAKPMKLEKKSFDVSVVIPAYNQMQLTRECLEAISNDASRVSYEVIVVDNHSTDDTPKLLEAVEGDIKVLRESMNRGFASACNRGARLADGKYLLFLNNDTAPQSGWLDAMVECAEQNESTGAVGAKLLYPNGKVQHSGIVFNEEKTPFNLFQNFASDHPAVNEEREMQAVSAACMLVPTAVFEEMGGFDEAYKNGFEDVDFCLRLAQTQRKVVYCPRAEVIHHEESTEGRKDHDDENLELFLSRWAARVRADDKAVTARFGLRIEWNEKGGVYVNTAQESPASTKENEDSSTLIDQASKKYLSGDYDGAVQVLQRVVESKMTLGNEDGFEAWQTLGNCYARLNQAEEAEKAYLEAVRLNDNSERPYLGLGSVAMLQQNWIAAQYGFMAALAKNPKTTRGEFGIGISLAARNKHEEALDHFKSVMDAEPDNVEALFYLYRSAMESDNPLKALDPLEKYVLSHPNDKEFLYHFCGVLWKLGELTRAMEVCEQILEIDPEYSAAREAYEHMRNTIAEHV
ncbi:glycosyltransferase [bacterium]|nr:glycosyltransferase [bacterium]